MPHDEVVDDDIASINRTSGPCRGVIARSYTWTVLSRTPWNIDWRTGSPSRVKLEKSVAWSADQWWQMCTTSMPREQAAICLLTLAAGESAAGRVIQPDLEVMRGCVDHQEAGMRWSVWSLHLKGVIALQSHHRCRTEHMSAPHRGHLQRSSSTSGARGRQNRRVGDPMHPARRRQSSRDSVVPSPKLLRQAFHFGALWVLRSTKS